jgi:hypothetical protein
MAGLDGLVDGLVEGWWMTIDEDLYGEDAEMEREGGIVWACYCCYCRTRTGPKLLLGNMWAPRHSRGQVTAARIAQAFLSLQRSAGRVGMVGLFWD